MSALPPDPPRSHRASARARTQIVALANGQRIAFNEYGVADGVPVFFCHGWPASRLQAGLLDADARDLGVRIISPDRPGVGMSPVQVGRTLRDWPVLLARLADQLGIGDFRVLGVSGGGPYALAAAWGLPERIRAISVVCSAPSLVELDDMGTLYPAYRWLLRSYRHRPRVLRWLFRAARPFAILQPPQWTHAWILRSLPPPEAETLADPHIFATCFSNYRESWSGGADGLFTDAAIYANPWGFELEDIRPPVRLWHGKEDRNFSWELSRAMAERLPRCTARFVENEAHYSLAIRCRREILADLIGSGAA